MSRTVKPRVEVTPANVMATLNYYRGLHVKHILESPEFAEKQLRENVERARLVADLPMIHLPNNIAPTAHYALKMLSNTAPSIIRKTLKHFNGDAKVLECYLEDDNSINLDSDVACEIWLSVFALLVVSTGWPVLEHQKKIADTFHSVIHNRVNWTTTEQK